MPTMSVPTSAMLEDLDLTSIQDERIRQCIVMLLNLVEDLTQETHSLREENQRLRDEINRLKGEQGKPSLKAGTQAEGTPPRDHSSERERHRPKAWTKSHKLEQITIDREEVLRVNPVLLPADAEFKGYEAVVVQDIRLQTDNVRFLKEKFYSACAGKTYLAELPPGYEGEFGPGLRAQVIVLSFACQMTEPKILEWLGQVGVQISQGQISNLLIKGHGQFHAEKDSLYEAGLRSSPWQHLDDTGTRVNGQNYHCHIVDNPLHTTYLTTASKDRLTVIDVLRNGQPRTFRLNGEALGYLESAGVSGVTRQKLSYLARDQDLDAALLQHLLDEHLPKLGAQTRKWIVDATAVAAYHAQTQFPVVRLLICDGALQFSWVTEELALCWVHEGRHYKKLVPMVPLHRALLDDFLDEFWDFYHELLAYRHHPRPQERTRLAAAFDTVFTPVTGYRALDERIALTRAKKGSLLMVLEHPEISLHNNPAELGARQRVRKRAISFGPRTSEGTKAWDTFMSLAATAKKLGVNFYHYIHDRISRANQIPSLASLIDERAKELNLGASWAPT